MKIMSFDPGGTTGYCIYEMGTFRLEIGQLEPDHHYKLWKMLYQETPDIVVCERFSYQRRDKVNLTPVEYIGVLRLWAITHNRDLVEQTPAAAKNLWTDSKVKSLKLWQPRYPHGMDALRHMMYYVTVTMKDLRWVEQLRVEQAKASGQLPPGYS